MANGQCILEIKAMQADDETSVIFIHKARESKKEREGENKHTNELGKKLSMYFSAFRN